MLPPRPSVKQEHTDNCPGTPQIRSFMLGTSPMILRPQSNTLENHQSFSHQFLNSHELGAYTLLNVSPAQVDPNLRNYIHVGQLDSDHTISPLRNRANPSSSGVDMMRALSRGQQLMMAPHPYNQAFIRPASSASHSRGNFGNRAGPSSSSQHHPESIRTVALYNAQAPRRTKRYQYWTKQEDHLVQELREVHGWTWKDISSELHSRLGGVHTWQAVQMRYLRTSKNPTSHVGRKKRAPVIPPQNVVVDDDLQDTPNLAEIEKAIAADWEGRWLRLSAKLCADITPAHTALLVKNKTQSTKLKHYLEG